MYVEPSSHTIDKLSGELSNSTGRYEKKISDLKGIYADEDAYARMCETDGEQIVYRVNEVRPEADRGDLIFGTTHMSAGKIGDEYFVTRGHIHACANRPETYYGESGLGLMLLESPDGKTRIMEIGPKTIVYVPPTWIHRSINIGSEPLVMSFCYPVDSGQDYEVIARSNGMAKRIVEDGPGWKAVNNENYLPRSAEQIQAIQATQD